MWRPRPSALPVHCSRSSQTRQAGLENRADSRSCLLPAAVSFWLQRASGAQDETISMLGHGTQAVSGAGLPLLQCVDRG